MYYYKLILRTSVYCLLIYLLTYFYCYRLQLNQEERRFQLPGNADETKPTK